MGFARVSLNVIVDVNVEAPTVVDSPKLPREWQL